MKWYEVTSVEDLKEIGKLNAVKIQINKDIKKITGRKDLTGFIKMGSNSWKGQYEKILALKKIADVFNNQDKNNIKIGNISAEKGQVALEDNEDDYFKSISERYIFCLLELSGEERMRQLKIYKSLYINKDAAREWYTKIAKEIHPDTCKNKRAVDAMSELTAIYKKMGSYE